VNAELQRGGYLQVEVLDENDRAMARSKMITGDQLAVNAIAGLKNTPVRLCFRLKGGHLYSFWFTK
jgi:hypothetical protein